MRRSPSFPCAFCEGRDWSYDQDEARWICNQCLRTGRPIPSRPSFESTFKFDDWYQTVMDEFETINRAIAEAESLRPESRKEQLIHGARLKKLNQEHQRVLNTCYLADQIKLIKEWQPEGDLYIRVPELEIRIQW